MSSKQNQSPPISEQSLKAVKAIWNAVAQPAKDGKKYISFSNRNDIVYLYCTGFVDENRFTLHDWVESFKDGLKEDGSYLLNEEQWMEKARHRYTGPIGKHFDPMLIKEGEWPERDMEGLIQMHILPAVYFTESEFRSIFDEAKDTFYANGIYRITQQVKEDLKKMIDLYPSPAQVRALGVAEAKAEMEQKKKGSGFTTGPAQSQMAAQRLSDLLSRSGGKS
jgi:hypothetical protein